MPQRKPILLIEDDEDYVRLVTSVLAASGDLFQVHTSDSVAGGFSLIAQRTPEVILLDLNLTDSSGYETFLRVREHARGIPIIVLTALDDDQLAVRAVADGAQDYLVKSLIQPKLIARCLNMALTRQKRQSSHRAGAPSLPGLVFSFIGSKGGVGTSTTAINVGALLALNGFDTAVLELQQGRPGTLSLYLQREPAEGLNSLLKKPPEGITTAEFRQCLVEAVAGLHLLCSTAAAGAWRALDADHAHTAISLARRMCRFVILDLPPRIDQGIAQALKLSDAITLLVDREAASIHCGAAFLPQLRIATSRTREIQLAIVDRSALESPLSLPEIKNQLKIHPLVIIPSAGEAIAFSHSAKTPLVLLYPNDPFSQAHFELAERLLAPAAGAAGIPALGQALLSHKAAWRTIPETTYS